MLKVTFLPGCQQALHSKVCGGTLPSMGSMTYVYDIDSHLSPTPLILSKSGVSDL